MTTEERRTDEAAAASASAEEPPETVYKTKVVQFLGRPTPIVLQNDNGPCPLLAICNVLLLKNNLNLSLDASEVSLQKLLSLVAERLIDSNSNVQDKDDAYVNNQQQNIADAIDLLPRLATGIDVNVHFRKINDFEFTRECAIFDLLDIGLYHGWIVDPQDTDTAAAIGSNSYNTLVAELVAFDARKSDGEKVAEEEDFVDFAAATAATLGVPSPNLSRGRSFDDCQVPISDEQTRRRGDFEEEEELKRALNLSRVEISGPDTVSVSPVFDCTISSANSSDHVQTHCDASLTQIADEFKVSCESDKSTLQEINEANNLQDNVSADETSLFPSVAEKGVNHITPDDSRICEGSGNSEANIIAESVTNKHTPAFQSHEEGSSGRCCSYEDLVIASENNQSATQIITEDLTSQTVQNVTDDPVADIFFPAPSDTDSHSLKGETLSDVPELITSSLGSTANEPIYEGEECILESGHSSYENREPVYEGEVILAEQANKAEDNHPANTTDKDTQKRWQLVKNFLDHNASQLTFYGLFCLQEGLKERELCVFFRNNHFSTMFKFNGELYLLATDQGYINQPDLVWEKLNEVNGDTVFMTGNFTEFKAESQVSESWNEQSAMSSTADYLAALGSSSPSNSDLNSDLQLAIALQQQEFEQQQPQPQPQPQSQRKQQASQPSSGTGRSRLITGPQVSRNPSVPQKSDSKAKDKCTVM